MNQPAPNPTRRMTTLALADEGGDIQQSTLHRRVLNVPRHPSGACGGLAMVDRSAPATEQPLLAGLEHAATRWAERRAPGGVRRAGGGLLAAMLMVAPAAAGIINVPGDQPTIQAGIDAAVNGDEVVLAPGEYQPQATIDFKGKAITLRSASGNPADTIISGAAPTDVRVVQCVSGEGPDTVLSGLTITRGFSYPNRDGGGMYIQDSSPTVIDCVFSNNRANRYGSGMAITNGSPWVIRTLFTGNANDPCLLSHPELAGGGMANIDSNPTVIDCTFRTNRAYDSNCGDTRGKGGGMANIRSSPSVINCMFDSNQALQGGAMYNDADSSPTVLTNCTFRFNDAYLQGGVMYNRAPVTVSNSIFYYNTQSGDQGSVMFNTAPATVTNCIFWNNSYWPQIVGPASVNHSTDVWGYPGTGNIDSTLDPLWVDPFGGGPGSGGDYRLQAGSPYIDAGDNTAVPADVADLDGDGDTGEATSRDLAGKPRFIDDSATVDTGASGNGHLNVVDIGAYEFYTILSVPADVSTIQAAIDMVSNGEAIVVAPGTYVEAINFNGKAISVRSVSANPADTIIDGNGAPHVVQCVSGEGPDTVLSGFTITGGNGVGASYPDNNGGGMLNLGSSPTVTNCVFSGNTADFGGGMANRGASPTVTDCTFSGNAVIHWGGGMLNDQESSSTVTNCSFSDNTANFGGGMANNGSTPTVTNCLFSSNAANSEGGGMFNYGREIPVTNCTFVGNSAGSGGGAMVNLSSPIPLVKNCVLAGNSPDEIQGGAFVTFSNVQGGYAGVGNIDLDPMFVDAGGGDYRLSPGSPCIDAADNTALPADGLDLDGDLDTVEPIPFDLDRNPRFVDDPGTADTGVAGNGYPDDVVDMGAYEYRDEGSAGPIYSDDFESGDVSMWSAIVICGGWTLESDNLPPGSYKLTCSSCEVTDCTLACDCEDIFGTPLPTQLDLQSCNPSANHIDNLNGNLSCSPDATTLGAG